MRDFLTLMVIGSIDVTGRGLDQPLPGREFARPFSYALDALVAHAKKQDAHVRVLAGAASVDTTTYGVEALAASEAVRRGLPLQLLAPGLPAPLTDAQCHAERQIWLGATSDEPEYDRAIDLCGEIGLAVSDLVLWIWPGLDLAKDDCQVHVVRAAALAMKPVVWIGEGGNLRVLDMRRLASARRNLIASGEPSAQWISDCFSAPLKEPDLLSWLQKSLVATDSARGPDLSATSSSGSSGARLHTVLLSLVQGKPLRAFRALMAGQIEVYRGPTWPDAENDLIAPTPILDKRFDSSDLEASAAAGKYRSAVWISSAASTMAVFAAVAGAISLWPGRGGPLWAVLEVILVVLIVGLLWRVKQQEWHARWIATRFLAEQLRYSRMGLPLMAFGRSVFEPSIDVMVDKLGQPELAVTSPELRSLQRCLAATGLPGLASGGVIVAASEHAVARQRGYVLGVIDDQIAYHDKVHADQHAAGHVLHTLTVVLFCLTGIAIGGHFFLHADWLLIFTAFFPALAAGVHGLATSLEISRLAEQSGSTASALREIADAIRMTERSADRLWGRWLQLRHLARAAAELMSEESGQWQQLVKHQKPKLPA